MAYIPYDSTRRVPFLHSNSYTRDEYDWWVKNTGQPTKLFTNGIYTEQETGTFDLQMESVWAIQPHANNIKIGVVDIYAPHGLRIVELAQKTAPGAIVTLLAMANYLPETVAATIQLAINAGNHIIVVATGWPTPSDLVRDALIQAKNNNIVVVCSTINNAQNLDVTPDYPTAYQFDNVLSVAGVDRNGVLYWSGYGTNVICAPSRNIMANGTYSTGTSYASPIVAGCLALYKAKYPWVSCNQIVTAARTKHDVTPSCRRFNALKLINYVQNMPDPEAS